MEQMLMEAAEKGDIDALYSLIGQDPLILEYFDRIPFSFTPLHKAAEARQTKFAMEIVRLKPSFARKLNQDGFSPIHLASTNGDVKMVKKLMGIDKDLCLFKGREGRTPLHCASVAGNIDVIDEILYNFPKALEELTVGDETVLHLAVKNNKLEAFKVLVGWLKWYMKMELLKWKDEEGNTVLHIATSTNQRQIVQMLVKNKNMAKLVEINAKNMNGLTAFDILQILPGELDTGDIRVKLRKAGAVRAQDLTSPLPHATTTNHSILKMKSCGGKCTRYIVFRMMPREMPHDVRNALLVVAVLIATTTYQIGINPPAIDWYRNDNNISTNTTTFYQTEDIFDIAGSYIVFAILNSLAFYTSLVMIAVLSLGLPLYRLVVILLFSMLCTYVWSAIHVQTGDVMYLSVSVILSVVFLVITLIVGKYIKKIK